MIKTTLILLSFLLILSCASGPTLLSKGKAALKQNKQTEALAYFEEALKADPDCVVARFYAAEIYSAQGKYDKAIEYSTAITDLKPYYRYKEDSYYNIAAIYFNQKKYKEAIEIASKTGFSGKEIITMSLEQLDIPYDLDAHPKSKISIPYPPDETQKNMVTAITLTLDIDGNIVDSQCDLVGHYQTLCKYAKPYFKEATFSPPYNIRKDGPSASTVISYIAFIRNKPSILFFHTHQLNLSHTDAKKKLGMLFLTPTIIHDIITKHKSAINQCYEKELTKDSSLMGRVVANFTIESNGIVKKTEIKRTTIHNKTVEKCILKDLKDLNKITSLVFPPQSDGKFMIINHSFDFHPKKTEIERKIAAYPEKAERSIAQKEYKKAIEIASNAGIDGTEIIHKALSALGIGSDTEAHPPSNIKIPYPPSKKSKDIKTSITFSVDKEGEIISTRCEGDDEQKSSCEYVKPYFKTLKFKPPYDIITEKISASEVYAEITLHKYIDADISFQTVVGNISAPHSAPVIIGELSADIINRVMRKNIIPIRRCYESERKNTPSLHGEVTLNFIIESSGIVSKSTVKKTNMNNRTVETCIANAVGEILFPQTEKGGIVIVNYPFVFKHSEGEIKE